MRSRWAARLSISAPEPAVPSSGSTDGASGGLSVSTPGLPGGGTPSALPADQSAIPKSPGASSAAAIPEAPDGTSTFALAGAAGASAGPSTTTLSADANHTV